MEDNKPIGTASLCHIALLVRDIEKAITNWSELLGLPKPEVWHYPAQKDVPSFTNGEAGDYSDCKLATFKLDNVQIELVEPGEQPSPYKETMDTYGEGLQHLSFIVPDRKTANAALSRIGAPAPYHIGYFPNGTYSFSNSRPQLGAEINIKTNDDNTEKIALLKSNPDTHKKDIE